MKYIFNIFLILFAIIGLLGIIIAGTQGDNQRYKHTLELTFVDNTLGVEHFVDRISNPKGMFNEGCINDLYSKKICGVRSMRVIKSEKIK